jgi:hypothetical protein
MTTTAFYGVNGLRRRGHKPAAPSSEKSSHPRRPALHEIGAGLVRFSPLHARGRSSREGRESAGGVSLDSNGAADVGAQFPGHGPDDETRGRRRRPRARQARRKTLPRRLRSNPQEQARSRRQKAMTPPDRLVLAPELIVVELVDAALVALERALCVEHPSSTLRPPLSTRPCTYTPAPFCGGPTDSAAPSAPTGASSTTSCVKPKIATFNRLR